MSGALLDRRVAVITGAAGGIGLAIARAFASQGAIILLADINAAALSAAQQEIAGLGASVLAQAVDICDPEAVEQMVRTAVNDLGGLDILVNNAGITRDATLRTMTLDQWHSVLDVHLTGAFLGIRAAAPHMRVQKRGSIINMSSISGKVGLVGQTNYSAAKAGMIGLTKAAAKELAHHGVRVNAIQPGLIRTPLTASLREDIWKQKLAEIPMGRVGEADEVASVALFLASDWSSYMTGTVLEVTGGRYM